MHRLLLFIFLLPCFTYAQQLPNFGFDKIKIADGNTIVQAETLPVSSAPSVKFDRFYYWCNATIHMTKGGYSGKLLNGNYDEYYSNKSLKTQGVFKEGLKEGYWKEWTENGALTSLMFWKKGLRDGSFCLYNEKGELLQAGQYKNDLLTGKIKFYHPKDSVEVVRYDKGIIVTKKHTSLLSKVNIFKKHPKSPDPAVPNTTTPKH